MASTVLELTGWTPVRCEGVEAIYRWLFGDDALFVLWTEMRLEAGLHMVENRGLREVRVPHSDAGELALVTREGIRETEMPTTGCWKPPSGTRRSRRGGMGA